MSCPGLHCPECAGGGAGAGLGIAVLAALEGAEWLAAHLIEVIATGVVCGALAVAAAIALGRWADRRDARIAARWEFRYVREIPAANPTAVPPADRPALGFRDLHIHLDGAHAAEQAHAIRQALDGN